MLKPRILVVGDICTELIITTDAAPGRNEKTEAERLDYMPGGDGTASSIALTRLGADAVLCSVIGDDTYGNELSKYLLSEKVDTRFLVEKRGENTPIDVIIKELHGASSTLSHKGALYRFADYDVEEAFISYPDAVMLHGSLPSQVIDETVKQARHQEVPLFIVSLPDPSKYPLSRLGECEMLIVDEDEAYRFTGIRPSDQEKCMKACIAMMQRVKAKYIIIRLEERGSFLFDGTFYSFISSYDVPETNGSSSTDAFSAALTLEYLRSEGDIRRACDFATIVSAVYLSRGGELKAYPFIEEVKRFIVKNEIDFELYEGEK